MMNVVASNQPRQLSETYSYDGGDQVLANGGSIELHLHDVSQLFDALDPSPFRIKDLDRRAEEYIVESAKELASRSPCALVIHLDRAEDLPAAGEIGDAIRVHFARRSYLLRSNLRSLLRRGLISLAIGMTFLATFFVIAQLVGRSMGDSGLARLFREGLIIVGWVAMWRPLEIFLYDWWPIVGERRLHDRLSRIAVRVSHDGSSVSNAAASSNQNAAAALARWENEGGRVSAPDPQGRDASTPGYGRLYVAITLILQAALTLGLVLFILRHDWENVFLTVSVIALTVIPAFVLRRYRVYVPPEFQLIATVFVFLSLFLGSARDFYYHFWWWDMILHAGSGFLFGIVGWIVLFLLNQTHRLPAGVRPEFLCFFGVTFAVFVGVLWEIFEFTVDTIWPHVNMMSSETGVADTMHDLIVDTLGAITVAFMGLAYARTGTYSFLVDAVRGFVRKNPRLFGRHATRIDQS